MKKILTYLLILTRIFISAQTNYANKIYIAEIGASCKKMTNGGCMIYSYCVLKFDKDSVGISYPVKASCSPQINKKIYTRNNDNLFKKHKWLIVNDTLAIKNCDVLKKYSFKETDEKSLSALFQNEESASVDTLVLYEYIGGKPSFLVLDAERRVAKKWGFEIVTETGDCTTNHDETKNAFNETRNKPVYEFLTAKFGNNWRTKFDNEVAEVVKSVINSNNSNIPKIINTADSLVLKGKLVDAKSKETLPGGMISFKNQNIKTGSNIDGDFVLVIKTNTQLKFPLILHLSYICYKQLEVKFENLKHLENFINQNNIVIFEMQSDCFDIGMPVQVVKYKKRSKKKRMK